MDSALENINVLNKKKSELSQKHVSNAVGTQLRNRIIKLGRETHMSEQYSRRECVEIVGIPQDAHSLGACHDYFTP